MTMNRPSSRSLQLQSNILITAYWMQQQWTDTVHVPYNVFLVTNVITNTSLTALVMRFFCGKIIKTFFTCLQKMSRTDLQLLFCIKGAVALAMQYKSYETPTLLARQFTPLSNSSVQMKVSKSDIPMNWDAPSGCWPSELSCESVCRLLSSTAHLLSPFNPS